MGCSSFNSKSNGMNVQEVNGWRTVRDMQPQWNPNDVAGMGVATASTAANNQVYIIRLVQNPDCLTVSQMYAQDIQMDVTDPSGRKHSRSWDMTQGPSHGF